MTCRGKLPLQRVVLVESSHSAFRPLDHVVKVIIREDCNFKPEHGDCRSEPT